MNPETQLQQLLSEHRFQLARQRKHKIYRNPDGLLFVAASTPSDRWAAHNQLGDLRRILRASGALPRTNPAQRCAQHGQPAPAQQPELVAPEVCLPEPEVIIIPDVPELREEMTAGEWREWQRRYKHEVSILNKNARFYAVVDAYWERACEFRERYVDNGEFSPLDLAYTLRHVLLKHGYRKTTVEWYSIAIYAQGVLHLEGEVPLVHTTNKHVCATLGVPVLYSQYKPDGQTAEFRTELLGGSIIYAAQRSAGAGAGGAE